MAESIAPLGYLDPSMPEAAQYQRAVSTAHDVARKYIAVRDNLARGAKALRGAHRAPPKTPQQNRAVWMTKYAAQN